MIADAEVRAFRKSACPGIAIVVVVVVVTDAEEARDHADDDVVRGQTTDPYDVGEMSASRAVIAELGGSTSHAAAGVKGAGCGLRRPLRRRHRDLAGRSDRHRRWRSRRGGRCGLSVRRPMRGRTAHVVRFGEFHVG